MSRKSVNVQFDWGVILFLVFLVLKLTEVISWSWLWVTAPLWIPAGLAVVILVIVGVVAVVRR